MYCDVCILLQHMPFVKSLLSKTATTQSQLVLHNHRPVTQRFGRRLSPNNPHQHFLVWPNHRQRYALHLMSPRITNIKKMLAGVEALAQGCRKLKFFIAKGCLQINDKAVSCLANNCPNLESINLHSCSVSFFKWELPCVLLCAFRTWLTRLCNSWQSTVLTSNTCACLAAPTSQTRLWWRWLSTASL